MPADQTKTEFHGYAVTKENGSFEPWSYRPRPLAADELEIAIEFCGICGSDLHTIGGGWGKVEFPIIVGHEIVGTVAAVGDKVTRFKVGDRVGCGAQCGCCADFPKEFPDSCRGCQSKQENMCASQIGTYNGKYPDGQRSQGGYCEAKRLNQRFVFKIPENISSPEAAPLLCAGVTVFAPLNRFGVKGKKVAIVGLGGLGHLAVQFAHKMGAEVTVIGHSEKKADLAKKLGASGYISTKDEKAYKQVAGSFDLVLCTSDGKGQDWNSLLALGRFDAHFILVAIPDEPLPLKAITLCKTRVLFTGSMIGSPDEIREMLEFAAANDVRPMIEIMPMSKVNEGIKKVQDNDVKFRVVLEQGK